MVYMDANGCRSGCRSEGLLMPHWLEVGKQKPSLISSDSRGFQSESVKALF